MSEGAAARYVMGHNDRERRRLALQASILNPLTEHLLIRAGITRGMRVVEFGCGVGDVTLIAARLVGRHGSVTAIDFDVGALAMAEERVRDQGLMNVSFVRASIDEFSPEGAVDAVIGRHILIHSPDPLAILLSGRRMLRDGGVAVFQEFDFSMFPPTYPSYPLRDRVCAVFTEFFSRVTHGNMGARLFHLFEKAGFHAPDCRGEFTIDGGAGSPGYEWVAESLRSIAARRGHGNRNGVRPRHRHAGGAVAHRSGCGRRLLSRAPDGRRLRAQGLGWRRLRPASPKPATASRTGSAR